MLNTVTRIIDNAGRVVIPHEARKALNIEKISLVDITVGEEEITIKKHKYSCVFCGETDCTNQVGDKFICDKHLKMVKEL